MTYAWGPETSFFYENTSFVLEDEVKNPVSLSKCVQDCEYNFKHCPINCRETARHRVLISGNINSDATGNDITGKINRIGR